MSVRLDDTTAAEVSTAISAERFRQGSSAVGRVLTLVIIADEANQADAVRAAAEAAREHPCRILTAIPRPGRGPARLDAEITVGGADGLGELAELRLRGPLHHHVASVVLPLLVPDAPVVVWWPGGGPEVPADDPVGRLAQRRITDAAESGRPLKALDQARVAYHAGDTDLSWTRITPWRALLASALDQPTGTITGAAVSAQRSNPSAMLLATWLQSNLGVPVALHASRGPGITGVSIRTDQGDITVTRPDGRIARMTRPGFPEREAALHRRTTDGLIAEELRRLDPDEIYGETLAALPGLAGWTVKGGTTRTPLGHAEHEAADGTDIDPGGAADASEAARRKAISLGQKPPSSRVTRPPAKKTGKPAAAPAARKAATTSATKTAPKVVATKTASAKAKSRSGS